MSRHKVRRVASKARKLCRDNISFKLRQSQHNVEMELCRNIEIYCHKKRLGRTTERNVTIEDTCVVIGKNICRDQGFYVVTYHSSINTTRYEINVVTDDTSVATITRHI